MVRIRRHGARWPRKYPAKFLRYRVHRPKFAEETEKEHRHAADTVQTKPRTDRQQFAQSGERRRQYPKHRPEPLESMVLSLANSLSQLISLRQQIVVSQQNLPIESRIRPETGSVCEILGGVACRRCLIVFRLSAVIAELDARILRLARVASQNSVGLKPDDSVVAVVPAALSSAKAPLFARYQTQRQASAWPVAGCRLVLRKNLSSHPRGPSTESFR